MTVRIVAFLLLMFVSAINLYLAFPAVKTVMEEGISYRFESWNFMFWVFIVPFNLVLYVLAILFLILAIRKNKKFRLLLTLPLFILLLKLFLSIFFSHGLKDIELFNLALVRDYAIDCFLFLLSLFSLVFHIVKIREFPLQSLKYSRKTGLL